MQAWKTGHTTPGQEAWFKPGAPPSCYCLLGLGCGGCCNGPSAPQSPMLAVWTPHLDWKASDSTRPIVYVSHTAMAASISLRALARRQRRQHSRHACNQALLHGHYSLLRQGPLCRCSSALSLMCLSAPLSAEASYASCHRTAWAALGLLSVRMVQLGPTRTQWPRRPSSQEWLGLASA